MGAQMIMLNGEIIEVTQFPDGTTQVWKLSPDLINKSHHKIVWNFSHEAEILYLAQLKALLDLDAQKTELEIQYLPYARQDKSISNDATFALRPFCAILNSLKFDQITIYDPHSSIATDLINNSKAIYPVEQVAKAIKITESNLVCYPDKGARTRYSSIYPFDSIYGEKVRNQQTGNISSYQVVGDPKGKRILIIDDICDGGATFVYLVKELLSKGAETVSLFVTHGLFTKGLASLNQSGIKRIFTKEAEVFEYQNQISYKEI